MITLENPVFFFTLVIFLLLVFLVLQAASGKEVPKIRGAADQ
jgi:hypothetical protein